MKARLFGSLGSLVAVAAIVASPLAAIADGYMEEPQPQTQVRHKLRKHRAARTTQQMTRIIEKNTVVERPVVVEKVVEKQVFVDRPTIVEKEVIVDRPVEIDRKVVVEHAKHRKHLFHLGIPFIGVDLF